MPAAMNWEGTISEGEGSEGVEPGEAISLIPGVIMGKDGLPAEIETLALTQEVDSRAAGAALAEVGLQGAGNGRPLSPQRH